MNRTGVVVIGQNEGEHLHRCIQSVSKSRRPLVYVDSGSSDGSVEVARSMGVEVVELDHRESFSAARGRNAGVEHLIGRYPDLEFIQFVDGDCELVDGWVERAECEMDRHPEMAAVAGRLRERSAGASVYNMLCDVEWQLCFRKRQSCGGIFLVRVRAFVEVGGFDPRLRTGEEPELCQRMRRHGRGNLRVDVEMATHDAAMLCFRQWWRRQLRSGYSDLENARYLGHAKDVGPRKDLRSTRVWAIGWPVVFIIWALVAATPSVRAIGIVGMATSGLMLPLQMFRVALKVWRQGEDPWRSAWYGVFVVVGKWPQLLGHLCYWRDSLAHRNGNVAGCGVISLNKR